MSAPLQISAYDQRWVLQARSGATHPGPVIAVIAVIAVIGKNPASELVTPSNPLWCGCPGRPQFLCFYAWHSIV